MKRARDRGVGGGARSAAGAGAVAGVGDGDGDGDGDGGSDGRRSDQRGVLSDDGVPVGEEMALAVEDLDEDGAGVGRAERGQMEVHVAGALPGETVRARLQHRSVHGRKAWAELLCIEHRSEDRVAPTCPAQGRCGGCIIQHLAYPAQVRWKEATVASLVARSPVLRDVELQPMIRSPKTEGYRNNAKLVVARDRKGRVVLGAYGPRSHDVVDLEGCRLVEPVLEEVASAVRALCNAAADIDVYDEVRRTGSLRYVTLRSNAAGQVLVTLVTARERFAAAQRIAEALRAMHPGVVGVVQNINPTVGNVLFGERERTLAGQAALSDQVGEPADDEVAGTEAEPGVILGSGISETGDDSGRSAGVRVQISSRAFFQVNRDVAAVAYRLIREEVELSGATRVLDAYGGVGGIALTLAGSTAEVVGIDANVASVQDAISTARRNGLGHVQFVAGDAGLRMAELAAGGRRFDVVVLNPPRKGCAPEVLDATARLAPRTVAYLSCSPRTLIRDLETLATRGYAIRRLIPLDMLPHTPHIELLAIATANPTT